MKLWPHQERGLQETADLIAKGARNICFTSPTGGGKSLCIFERIRASKTSALYTDRRMLLDQTAKGMTGESIGFGYRAAGHPTRLLDDVQLCMIQTVHSRSIKGDRPVHDCTQVIIDEAHKNSGQMMQDILEAHQDLQTQVSTVGFTATPLGIGHLYDDLVVAGTNSELRDCGALVPAYHFGPDEPDTRWIGKIKVGEGECGIGLKSRMNYVQRVYGSVADHLREYNPELLPTVLFAPGVKESIWFAEKLTEQGIPSAHIDGNNCWLDGKEVKNDEGVREEILERSKSGGIKVICNRFVLREGINCPWFRHGIFATVFGGLTSYIQAGGRLLRSFPGKESCTIQDHGGNWWRHGSLNADREWDLEYTDKIVDAMRKSNIQEGIEREPIICPECSYTRMSGPSCPNCGHKHTHRSRFVMQSNGRLREMRGDIFRKRIELPSSEKLEDEWAARVFAVRKSKKQTVETMTFAQLEANFARDHNWKYPPKDFRMMPDRKIDWFRPIKDVPLENLK